VYAELCAHLAHVKMDAELTELRGTPAPPLTQLEFTAEDRPIAERMARELGYRQTAYTSSSCLWGLYCLPDHQRHRKGVIVKTEEFGLMFMQQLEDLYLGPDGRPRHAREYSAVRQTACRHCGQDIEGFAPYRKGEWRDRGNNSTCPNEAGDKGQKHAPVKD
jgi:hypothetical protein